MAAPTTNDFYSLPFQELDKLPSNKWTTRQWSHYEEQKRLHEAGVAPPRRAPVAPPPTKARTLQNAVQQAAPPSLGNTIQAIRARKQLMNGL